MPLLDDPMPPLDNPRPLPTIALSPGLPNSNRPLPRPIERPRSRLWGLPLLSLPLVVVGGAALVMTVMTAGNTEPTASTPMTAWLAVGHPLAGVKTVRNDHPQRPFSPVKARISTPKPLPTTRRFLRRSVTETGNLPMVNTKPGQLKPDSTAFSSTKEEVLKLIQDGARLCRLPKYAPLTNFTLKNKNRETLDRDIQEAVRKLEAERLYPPPVLKNRSALTDLNGPWRLIYADASEITRLYKLPLRFRPKSVFQRINLPRLTFENQAFLRGPFGLRSSIRVVSEFGIASRNTPNLVGKMNEEEDRIDVRFLAVIISLTKILWIPLPFRRVVKPRSASREEREDGIGPSLDITYVDDDLRIGRGGDGSLFVLVKDRSDPAPALSESEVNSLKPEDKIYDATIGAITKPARRIPKSRSLRTGIVDGGDGPGKLQKTGRLRRLWFKLRGKDTPKSDYDISDAWPTLRKICKAELVDAVKLQKLELIQDALRNLEQFKPTDPLVASNYLPGRWTQLYSSNRTGVLSGRVANTDAEVYFDIMKGTGRGDYTFSGESSTRGGVLNPGGLNAKFDGTIDVVADDELVFNMPKAKYQVLSTNFYIKTSRTGEDPKKGVKVLYLDENLLATKDPYGEIFLYSK